MNVAISWTGPVAVRPRGKHRLTLKQRLIRRNERVADELRRAQPKRNAKKAARTGILAAVAIPASLPGYKPALVATGLLGGVLFAIGGLW